MKTVSASRFSAQQGVALPVMLIVLTIMLISGAYLLKASNSSTLTAGNLAYQSALGRAADRALMEGSEWLGSTWTTSRASLDSDSSANGYVATLNTAQNVHSAGFWVGMKTFTDSKGNSIDYVIHRLCSRALPYNDTTNQCMQTTANTSTLGTSVAIGASLSSNTVNLAGNPQLHYIITARIYGRAGAT